MLSNVAYIICGIFLLKLNEKARKVAIVLSVIGILSAPFIANLTLKTTSLDESRIFKSEKQKILKQTKIEFREEALKNLEQSEETAKKIKELKISGVMIEMESWRYYPADNLASRVLGFVGYKGNELAGRYGIEKKYESELGRSDKNTLDRKSTRLNSSHIPLSRMPSSA